MAINWKVSLDKRSITINIENRFDFSDHKAFRESYEHNANSKMEFILDFQKTQYMDSSALGMLLLLRDFAGGDSANVAIINCSPDLKNILSIANFQKLFNIK